MVNTFKTWLLAPLFALTLASLVTTPTAQAAGDRDTRAGGGGARAAGSGDRAGAGKKPQANNVSADSRTNNVRNTSVNNVNNVNVNNVNKVNVNNSNNVDVNRNVNVNVNNNSGCCNNGWDNDYHPIGTAVAVGATVAVTSAIIGSIVNAPPPGCIPVNYGGMVYLQCGTTWYQPQGTQYVVIRPPY